MSRPASKEGAKRAQGQIRALRDHYYIKPSALAICDEVMDFLKAAERRLPYHKTYVEERIRRRGEKRRRNKCG